MNDIKHNIQPSANNTSQVIIPPYDIYILMATFNPSVDRSDKDGSVWNI